MIALICSVVVLSSAMAYSKDENLPGLIPPKDLGPPPVERELGGGSDRSQGGSSCSSCGS
ncbi:MAG: hypothetical protein K2W92_08480 [Alphaproteobacteria bacterium]|nr:hypothetical protein [Alphaproteobacteria bacterium]